MTKATKKSVSPRQSPSLFFHLFVMLPTILGTTTTTTLNTVEGFSVSSPLVASSHSPTLRLWTPSKSHSRLGVGDSAMDDTENRDREFARIRRRRGRYASDEDDGTYERGSDDSVMGAADLLEDEGFFDDMMDDDEDFDEDFDDDDDESYDMFSNTVIPNPLLDSIDPDGSAERFPELAADPRFWFDMFLFIAFLNFISFIGPRNPFPEMIPAMYNAGLPPPGI